METKYTDTFRLLSQGVHPIVGLYFEFAQLKNLFRQGWLKRGISALHCESVADHSFGVAMLGYVFAEEYRLDLDSSKVMRLGLFHDVCEIYNGDTTPSDGKSMEEISRGEQESIDRVFSKMHYPERYADIWREYQSQSTPEARFIKQVDRLEMALQANLYEKLQYQGLEEFFTYVKDRVSEPELVSILDELIK
jgi:putative hydrolases of HD superfamily